MSALSGLYPSFVGSSTVLNNGSSSNILTVALTNSNMFDGTSDELDITIDDSLDLAFYFIADAGKGSGVNRENENMFHFNWALADVGRVEAIVPHLYLPGETVDYDHLKSDSDKFTPHKPNIQLGKLSTLHGWKINSGTVILKPGDSILLVFSGIITNLPDGPSMAYLAYDQKHFLKCGPIKKTPNILSGQKVGIGTANPIHPLSIRTDSDGPKISIWDDGNPKHGYYGFGISYLQLNYHVLSPIGKDQYGNEITNDHVFYAGGDPSSHDDSGVELFRITGNGQLFGAGSLSLGEDDQGQSLDVSGDVSVGNGLTVLGDSRLRNNLTVDQQILTNNLRIVDEGAAIFKDEEYDCLIICNNHENGLMISKEGNVSIKTSQVPDITLALGNESTGIDTSDAGNLGFLSNGKSMMSINPWNLHVHENLYSEKGLFVNGEVDSIIKTVMKEGTIGGKNSEVTNTSWSVNVDFGVTFREVPEVTAFLTGVSAYAKGGVVGSQGHIGHAFVKVSEITTTSAKVTGKVNEGSNSDDNYLNFTLLAIGRTAKF